MKAVASIAAVAIAVSTLAACSTPSEVRARAPGWVVESKKDSKSFTGCIADKESEIAARYSAAGITIQTRPTSNGWVIQGDARSFGGTSTGTIIEIVDVPGGGSKATAYFADSTMRTKPSEDRAKECAK